MTTNKIAVGICLDESGSMGHQRDETIEAINEYVEGLKIEDDAVITLTMFDNRGGAIPTTRIYCSNQSPELFVPISHETYRPTGNTPLYDAVGKTIKDMERWVDDQGKQHEVLFVIMTDGAENASQQWTQQQVMDLIAYKEGEGWKFVFLGANMDEMTARQVGASLGMAAGATMGYSGQDSRAVSSGLSSATHSVARGQVTNSADALALARKEYDRLRKEQEEKQASKS